MRRIAIYGIAAAMGTSATGAVIAPEQQSYEMLPGGSVRVVWNLTDTSTHVFGYSLELVSTTVGLQTTGSVRVDLDQTNFFSERNVFIAAGVDLDPSFSLIQRSGTHGVFINASTADLSAVLPVDGVNDALAEVVFTASADAIGEFIFQLGTNTAISDRDGVPIAFSGQPLMIRVVPSPSGLAVCLVAVWASAARRRGR